MLSTKSISLQSIPPIYPFTTTTHTPCPPPVCPRNINYQKQKIARFSFCVCFPWRWGTTLFLFRLLLFLIGRSIFGLMEIRKMFIVFRQSDRLKSSDGYCVCWLPSTDWPSYTIDIGCCELSRIYSDGRFVPAHFCVFSFDNEKSAVGAYWDFLCRRFSRWWRSGSWQNLMSFKWALRLVVWSYSN